MKFSSGLLLFVPACAALVSSSFGADLPPDKGNTIPESGKRPVVVTLKAADLAGLKAAVPKAELPEGCSLSLAAVSPLVTHPIMGCLDDKGRLFVGDGVGVNWNKAQLEANPPNRVLMLEDTDKDGVFDRSTVFADKMTFPQGACWLGGSLYVCSPPGLWKLTDTDGDGVADKREMIVGGFEYTGNAADVHGPFLHQNGRLYWCHGRKGHKVTGKEGDVVHEGLACGIWSCKPDGSDVQWHALGCGDNPVEVDFTPEGDIIGVQNLYYTNPRGDTIVHWLYRGVYERGDQLKAIEGLPRTLEHMPVMYNFGHVAVSGCCFWHGWRGGAGGPVRAAASPRKGAPSAGGALQFMVTHFNTQRVVRMELTPDGGTYKATENEFLRLHNPDIHFTDVMEDPRDGSLLVIDTGGWFRIGCPSSLMAKSDLLGAIYRVKPARPAPLAATPGKRAAGSLKTALAGLKSSDALVRRRALEWMNENVREGGPHEDKTAEVNEALLPLMGRKLDPATEHALIAVSNELFTVSYNDLKDVSDPVTLRHMLQCFTPDDSASMNLTLGVAKAHLDAPDAELARVSLNYVTAHPDADEWVMAELGEWLDPAEVPPARLKALAGLCAALIAKPETQKLVSKMLAHASAAVRNTALDILAAQTGAVTNDAWLPALEAMLNQGATPLLFDAVKKLKAARFDARLQAIANDAIQPQALRLKALDTMTARKITGETFTMVLDVLTNAASSAAAKIQAAGIMAHSGHTAEERMALAKVLSTAGPVELKELLALLRATKEEDVLRAMVVELAKNPALVSQQESIYRTALADKPTDLFENIILPAYRKGTEAIDAKKRQLAPLAEKAASAGDAKAGRAVFEAGKGTCIACHQIGDKGRSIGPNLSHIGAIRTERDILESVLFPSNTLARDYEAHIIETSDGQSTVGVIKSHTAEGLLVVDAAGVEKNLPHGQIVGDTQLATSLMPMGLDQTVSEKELLDLVAWLRSLK